MMKNNKLLIVFILSISILSGCYDSIPPEEMSYVHALGVDYKDGKYIVYAQFINLSSLAKIEGGNNIDETHPEVAIGKSTNINDALFQIYKSTQQKVYWSNLTFLVVTEELMKKGLQEIFDLLIRYPETRYRIKLYSTNQSLEEALLFTVPLQTSTAFSKLARPENTLGQSSYMLIKDIRNFIIDLNEPSHEAIIPRLHIEKKVWKTDKGSLDVVSLKGVSIYHIDELFKGNLSEKDSEGLKWLNKDFTREQLIVKVGSDKYNALIVNKVKHKITPFVKGNQVKFKLSLKAKATINILESDYPLEELTKKGESIIKEQILNTYHKGLELNSDVYRLSQVLFRKENHVWKKINTNGKIPLNKDSLIVDVQLNIASSGKSRYNSNLK